jgi:hypothetical protein
VTALKILEGARADELAGAHVFELREVGHLKLVRGGEASSYAPRRRLSDRHSPCFTAEVELIAMANWARGFGRSRALACL